MPKLPYAGAYYKFPRQCSQAQTTVFVVEPKLKLKVMFCWMTREFAWHAWILIKMACARIY